MMVAFVIGESTNPFILGRTICERLGIEKGKKILGGIFLAGFLIIRVGCLTPYTILIQLAPHSYLTIKFTAGAMLFVSLLWALMILNKGAKELKQVYIMVNNAIVR